MISTEDLEFLQEQIRYLGNENKELKEKENKWSSISSKISTIFLKHSKDKSSPDETQMLDYLQSYIGSLQNEREQFGTKLETILTQKENDSNHDKNY